MRRDLEATQDGYRSFSIKYCQESQLAVGWDSAERNAYLFDGNASRFDGDAGDSRYQGGWHFIPRPAGSLLVFSAASLPRFSPAFNAGSPFLPFRASPTGAWNSLIVFCAQYYWRCNGSALSRFIIHDPRPSAQLVNLGGCVARFKVFRVGAFVATLWRRCAALIYAAQPLFARNTCVYLRANLHSCF